MFHVKSQFREKKAVLSIQKFPSVVHVLPRNAIMSHLIIPLFLLYYLSSGHLQEVKNKRKFQTFISKSGRSRLREVVAYTRFQIQ